jgi:hypothetical protein
MTTPKLDLSMKGVRNGPVDRTFTPAPPVVFSSEPVIPVAAPIETPEPVAVTEPVTPEVAPVAPVEPVVEEVTPVVQEETLSDIKPDEAPVISSLSEEELVEKVMSELETSRATIAEQAARILELEGSNKTLETTNQSIESTTQSLRERLESLILTGNAVVNNSGSSKTSNRSSEASASAVQYTPPRPIGGLNLR